MCYTGDASQVDYRFPNRKGKKIRHCNLALIYFLTHSLTPLNIQFRLNIFWELTAEDTLVWWELPILKKEKENNKKIAVKRKEKKKKKNT